MDLQVYEKPHLVIEWNTEAPVLENSLRSEDFVAFNTTCHLSFFHGSATGGGFVVVPLSRTVTVSLCAARSSRPNYAYELKLVLQNPPPAPLNITAYLSRGAESLLAKTTTIEHQGADGVIWSCTQSQLSSVLPYDMAADGRYRQDFSSFTFWVSIHAGGRPAFSEDESVQMPAHADAVSFEIRSLSRDLSKLPIDDPPIGHIYVVCRGRTFVAHRRLLAARSDVFRAMLESGPAEDRTTARVEIEDADGTMFELFLEYLYRGRLEALTPDAATELYKLADRYEVGALKGLCARYLEENLAPDIACDVLSLAELHSDAHLKEIATAYMVAQKIPLQEGSPEWSRFVGDHPLLAIEVMTRLCKSMAQRN